MQKKIFAFFLLYILFTGAVPFTACAETTPYFTYSLDAKSAAPNELVKLKINANQMYDTAAGFRIIIDYDDSVLSFVRTETSSQIKSGTMMTNGESNPIYSFYVCNVDQKTAPTLSGNIISFVFKVKDDAAEGKTIIGAHIDEICNYQAQELNLNYDEDLTLHLETEKHPSEKAVLSSLVPLSGKLAPQFSSEVFEYSMNVENTVKSVEFAAAAEDGGTVKINRKTLGKAGSDTAIVATVTSADKKNKAQYVVTVHRGESPVSTGSNSKGNSAVVPHKSEIKLESASTDDWYEPNAETAKGGTQTELQNTAGTNASQVTQANSRDENRNIYIIGNQMPTYVLLLLVCTQCVLIGIALSFWLNLKIKK